MLTAFLGNPETRTAALARLKGHHQAGELTSGALFFNGTKATAAAALIDSNDAQVWQDQLGLAKWLAYALDYSASNLSSGRAVELAEGLLNAIPVGQDTSNLGSRVIGAVLAAVSDALRAEGEAGAPLLAVCEQIRSLHAGAVAGDVPAPSSWRAVRKAATTAVNAIAEGQAKVLGGCVEAAAWDPLTAPTTVGDVLRLWSQALRASVNVDALFGWTAEDDARVRKLLAEMHEKYKKDKPEEERDVFMLLREHHPEVEARLLAYTQLGHQQAARAGEGAAKLLLDAMGTAQ